jgi:hypothetical protein
LIHQNRHTQRLFVGEGGWISATGMKGAHPSCYDFHTCSLLLIISPPNKACITMIWDIVRCSKRSEAGGRDLLASFASWPSLLT